MEYILKTTAVLGVFYLCYKLFLQRETFFQGNRWFLNIGLIASVLIPLIVIPIYITLEPKEVVFSFTEGLESSNNIDASSSFDWMNLIFNVYILGVILFGIRLSIQLFSLSSLIYRSKKYRSGKYIYVIVDDHISPFSFFNWVVYNPNQFNETELEQIIAHEKVHINQHHSIDLLLIQIMSVVLWCNPLLWFYKKEIEQNLEFIADNEAQKQSFCEKSYQHLLLKTSIPHYQMALTNNFYNSLIKKRIVMLHKSKSKQLNAWKYGLILPILALFLMSFNTKEVYVEKEVTEHFKSPESLSNFNYINNNEPISEVNEANVIKPVSLNKVKDISKILTDIEVAIISKDFSDNDFEKLKKELKNKGLVIKFKGIKRNSKGEITAIKIEANTKKSNVRFNTNSDDPIEPIKISFHTDGSNISIGNGKAKQGKNHYTFNTNGGKTKIHASGKGNNVFVYEIEDEDEEEHEHEEGEEHEHDVEIEHEHEEDEEHEDEEEIEHIIVKEGKRKYRVKTTEAIHHGSGDDKVYIIKTGEDGKQIKEEIIIKEGQKNVWHSEDGNTHKVKLTKVGKDNMFFFNLEDGEQPLIIYNGKEISKEEMEKLNPKTFKDVKVLKGDKAIKEHGEKAKDGVIIISSKD